VNRLLREDSSQAITIIIVLINNTLSMRGKKPPQKRGAVVGIGLGLEDIS